MKEYINIIKAMDWQPSDGRRKVITDYLDSLGVSYKTQSYSTGKNIIAELGSSARYIGVASHYDRISNAGGANDNASAVAVCLGLISRLSKKQLKLFGIRFFFFDQEEKGLLGSKAYVEEYGILDLVGLINMELVGVGDKLALWPADDYVRSGTVYRYLTDRLNLAGVDYLNFQHVPGHNADHFYFQKAGLRDCFTITTITQKDYEVAEHYSKAKSFEVDEATLLDILNEAPIFANYHKSTDTSENISADTIERVVDCLYETILSLDKAGDS